MMPPRHVCKMKPLNAYIRGYRNGVQWAEKEIADYKSALDKMFTIALDAIGNKSETIAVRDVLVKDNWELRKRVAELESACESSTLNPVDSKTIVAIDPLKTSTPLGIAEKSGQA